MTTEPPTEKWITVDLMTAEGKQTRWVGPAASKAAAEQLARELNPGAAVTSINIVKAAADVVEGEEL